MTIGDFIRDQNLDGSLLLGYYGGGNYGDELLLEVLQNMLAMRGVKRVAIAYQQPNNFLRLHDDFGYRAFNLKDKKTLLKTTLTSQQIIVGGGGLWGIDMNLNTLQMSVYLWICRWLLGKKVYLLGVGYYRSTSRLGHVGAWFAAKAANRIFARDNESYKNFRRFAEYKTEMDRDIAWYIADISLARYQKAARRLARQIGLQKQTLMLTTRRPQAPKQHATFERYNELVEQYITDNDRKIVLAPLEFSRSTHVHGSARYTWTKDNVYTLDPATNPLTIYTLFKLYHDRLVLIGPQFHIMLTAHLTHVPFLPICYDNKVRELFDNIGLARSRQLAVEDVTADSLRRFIDQPTAG